MKLPPETNQNIDRDDLGMVGSSSAGPQLGNLFFVLGGLLEGEIFREEGHQFCFDAVGNVIEMIALIDLKEVGNFVSGQHAVEVL